MNLIRSILHMLWMVLTVIPWATAVLIAAPFISGARLYWMCVGWLDVAVKGGHWILGIRPETDGLRIDPRIPSSWDGFEATRVFRGHRLTIKIANPKHADGRVKRLRLDGRAVEGNLIPVAALRDGLCVEATVEG